MIARVLLFAALVPLSALAQLQVFSVDGTNETPVGAIFNFVNTSPGDIVEVQFHVRNNGAGPVTLNFGSLTVGGEGFGIDFSASYPLPYTIAPYDGSPKSEFFFFVDFNPTDIATFNALLQVDTVQIFLQGNGVASAVLELAGSNIPLAANAIIDFGSVPSGMTKLLTFNLSNPSSATVSVNKLVVSGAGFKGLIGVSTPISIAPNQTVPFQVEFMPTSGLASEGALAVDQRTFVLTGQGLSPPLPEASIVFGSSVGQSVQQNNVSIPLAAASQVTGTGTLTMTFQSSVKGIPDDPAIQFLSGPLRQATVSIGVGDATANFVGNQGDLAFQTGATAGTITFTLTLNGNPTPAAQATLTIAPAPVSIQSATSIRLLGGIIVNGEPAGVNVAGEVDISVTAADNTYSASQLAFTFFDKNGATMQPGVIRVDATSDFQLYFNSTSTGGAFALLAKFAVTGDVTQIISTNVAITNSVGVTTTQQISIGN